MKNVQFQNRKINSLQVYRGVAAVLVVLFHITNYGRDKWNYNFLDGAFLFGYTGVDFFFVLSGFIIFFTHARDIGDRSAVTKYVTRRLIRVYPIYWMVTCAKIAAIILLPAIAKPYEREFSTIVSSFLLLPRVNMPIIAAAWTLSHEILFYLLFAGAIWFGWHWGMYVLTIWSVAILGFQVWQPVGPGYYILGFLFNDRNLEFLFGCASAYLIMNHRIRNPLWMALAGAGLYACAGWLLMRGGSVPMYTLWFGIPSLLLVTGSAAVERETEIVFPRLLVLLGDASYSIYLTHAMFVNIFTLIISRLFVTSLPDPFLLASSMFVGAILGGLAVYTFVESPLLFLLRRWTNPQRQPSTG